MAQNLYASKSLSSRKRNFSTTEKEAFTIHFGTQHFRVYLLVCPFPIIIDHNALRWLHSIEPKGWIVCWIMDLQEFQLSMQHQPGRVHNNVDGLSQLVPKQTDTTSSTILGDKCTYTRVVSETLIYHLFPNNKVHPDSAPIQPTMT